MGTRWAGQGRAVRRAADSATVDEGSIRAASTAGAATRRGEWSQTAADGTQGVVDQRPTRFRSLKLARPKLGTEYKVALSGLFFGSFLVVGGLFLADQDLLESWGYLGAFVISLISAATIVVPAPGTFLIMGMAEFLNPLLLGVVAGVAGGIGGATAYLAGAVGGKAIAQTRISGWMAKLFRSRWGPALLFIFNAIPFMPGDALSAMAGVIRYPLPKYFLYVTTSTVLKMMIVALTGAKVMELLGRTFSLS